MYLFLFSALFYKKVGKGWKTVIPHFPDAASLSCQS